MLHSNQSDTPPRALPTSSRYRVIRLIASGGMGAIYMGVQRGAAGFERQVAIKRAHAHLLDDPEIRQTILAEAHHGSLVRHPNVVSIDDVEEIADELLLVMDFIDGCSLAHLTRESLPLPVRIATRVALDACWGLDAIHTANDRIGRPLGLVHRDISPQNILIGLDGVSRITDFGIAKGIQDPGRTGPTMRRGKFGYMAPEYIRHRISTSHADMFALGIVFWEALAGRRLFDGRTGIECVKLAAAAEVPSLCDIRSDISPALDMFVQKTLSKSPHDRYASMAHMAEALEGIAGSRIATRAEISAFVAERREDEEVEIPDSRNPESLASGFVLSVEEPRSMLHSIDIDMSSLEIDLKTIESEMLLEDMMPSRVLQPILPTRIANDACILASEAPGPYAPYAAMSMFPAETTTSVPPRLSGAFPRFSMVSQLPMTFFPARGRFLGVMVVDPQGNQGPMPEDPESTNMAQTG